MSIAVNILVYAFLAFWLVDSLMEKDWWFAFVVSFVITISVVLSLLPRYHVSTPSPGRYPYDD